MKSKTKPDSLEDVLAGNVDIVGLDYITEYQNTDENVVYYYHCSLPGCFNEQGNPRQILKHLKSYSHKQAWIQTKFQIQAKTRRDIEEFLKTHDEDVSNFKTLVSDQRWLECKKARLRADITLKPSELVTKNTPSPSKASTTVISSTEITTTESVSNHSVALSNSAANLVQSSGKSNLSNEDVKTPDKNKDNLSKMADENSAERINDSSSFKHLSLQQYQRKNALITSSVKSNEHQVQGICPLESTSTTPSEPTSYTDPTHNPPSGILSIPTNSTLLEDNVTITSLSIRLSDKVALDLTVVNNMEQEHGMPEEEAFNNQSAKDLVPEEEPQQVVLEQRRVDKPNEESDEVATIEEPTEATTQQATASVVQSTLEKRTFVDVKPEIDAIIKPEPDSSIKEEKKQKDLLRLNTDSVEEVARKPGIPEDPEMKFKKQVTAIVNDILLKHYRYAPKADKDKDPESFKIQTKEEFERLNQKFSRKLREDIRESYSSMYGGIDVNDPDKLQTPIISYEELLGYPIEVEIHKYFEESANSRERKLKRV